MGRTWLITEEPQIEFVGDDFVRIFGTEEGGQYERLMYSSVHYAYCKKAVIAHERRRAERNRGAQIIPLRDPPG